jgi:hypothetical protein
LSSIGRKCEISDSNSERRNAKSADWRVRFWRKIVSRKGKEGHTQLEIFLDV